MNLDEQFICFFGNAMPRVGPNDSASSWHDQLLPEFGLENLYCFRKCRL